jgi:hypothetical protein
MLSLSLTYRLFLKQFLTFHPPLGLLMAFFVNLIKWQKFLRLMKHFYNPRATTGFFKNYFYQFLILFTILQTILERIFAFFFKICNLFYSNRFKRPKLVMNLKGGMWFKVSKIDRNGLN